MSKTPAVRKKKESKSKGIKVNELISSKESATADISKYLVKQPEYEVDCNGCDVSVPCPDDAALPCSTLSPLSNEAKKKTSIVKPSNPGSRKKNRKPNHGPRSSQITDFFPVRRSSRKTSKLTDKNKVIEDAILSGKEEGFEIKVYPDKGRGVITTKAIKRGEFVLEYYGELIDSEEAKRRETIYSDKENIGCYMYYFKIKNKQYCIDATKESDRLGRLVNHSKKGNLKTRTFLVKESPHLVLFADRDIQPGEELSYDYGDRRKTVLESHPWLAS